MLRDDLAIGEVALLRRTLLRREIDMHDAEAAFVALHPLEIVEEAPAEIAAQVGAVGARLQRGSDMAADVVGAERILDRVALHDLIEVAETGAVLGDEDRRIAVVRLDP